jgi:3-deoxy-D-manno-octulosonic-acid transferase
VLQAVKPPGYTPPTSAMYVLYSLLSVVALLVASPYLLYQAVRHRKYVRNLRQRLGYLPLSFNLDGEASIWIHAVSVGETLTSRALIGDLKARYPGLKLFLSTTTLTGFEVARKLADLDGVFYFPFDWGFTVRRTLDVVRPRLFVMMETEIWPTLLRHCRERGIATLLVNGRVSNRSFARYRLIRPFFRRVLDDVDRFCMQSDEASRRLQALGADPARITVTGSLKFDSLDWPGVGPHGQSRDRVLRFFRMSDSRPVVIAASTLRGEEQAACAAFRLVQARWPDALLIIAPRHPERFEEVTRLAAEEGFRVVRRTKLPVDQAPEADVVVLDTIGELARLFQVATVVFVGGSLVDAGGHNILEPAIFGKPIVFGPHMHNFAEIAAEFLRRGAAVEVHGTRELGAQLVELVGDPVTRARLGAAARALVESNRGAKARTLDVIAAVLPPLDAGRRGVVTPFRSVR